jgi:hypothetical protein
MLSRKNQFTFILICSSILYFYCPTTNTKINLCCDDWWYLCMCVGEKCTCSELDKRFSKFFYWCQVNYTRVNFNARFNTFFHWCQSGCCFRNFSPVTEFTELFNNIVPSSGEREIVRADWMNTRVGAQNRQRFSQLADPLGEVLREDTVLNTQ